MNLYRLNERHEPVLCESFDEWFPQFEMKDRSRHVAHHVMNRGTIRVSTVFLGIDHRYDSIISELKLPPILFETMIFGGDEEIDQYQQRYCTWNQAHTGHRRAVLMVRAWMKKKGIRIRNPKQLIKDHSR